MDKKHRCFALGGVPPCLFAIVGKKRDTRWVAGDPVETTEPPNDAGVERFTKEGGKGMEGGQVEGRKEGEKEGENEGWGRGRKGRKAGNESAHLR